MTKSLTEILMPHILEDRNQKPLRRIIAEHSYKSFVKPEDEKELNYIKSHIYYIRDHKFNITHKFTDDGDIFYCISSIDSFEIPIIGFDYFFDHNNRIYRFDCTVHTMCDQNYRVSIDLSKTSYAYDLKQIIMNGSYYDLTVKKEYHSPTKENIYEMCKSNL